MDTVIANTPLAPVHSLGRKGHMKAFRAQPAFEHGVQIRFISATNPWRVGCLGWHFYMDILHPAINAAGGSASVSDILALGQTKGYSESDCQGHLRWLYVWGGSYISANGAVYSVVPESNPVQAPAKPARKSKSKAKA